MKINKILPLFTCAFLLLTSFPVSTLAEEVTEPIESVESNGNIIDSYNTYNNYYYYMESKYDDINLVSLNNKDVSSYWRPKYNELKLPLQEYIEMKDKNVQVKTNGFDVDWSEIDKSSLPTSRALEKLGYDFLLYKETVPNTEEGTWGSENSTGEYSYNVERSIGYNKPITAPYFIMNVYKSLGIDLYDVYFQYRKEEAESGIYVTRTNPDSYWELFLNDHPINYSIYNDSDVSDITSGRIISTADAITILAEMLDFYGEPILSKQEEYLLLQVYGNEVPSSLPDSQKQAWSYLKSRGVIGDTEFNYNDNLSFDVMMDLLMRASDKDSRTNFKEIQITTNLDDTFIRNGYYQNEVVMVNQPKVSSVESSISFADATRYDFLIEMNNNIAFKFQDTGELNRDIFISKGPMHNDKAISGSVSEGIVEGRFYHFSVPISELKDVSLLYINSSKSGDWPLNYHIPVSMKDNKVGGVYSDRNSDKDDSIIYKLPKTFEQIFPDSIYVDSFRKNPNSSVNISKASAAPYGVKATSKFSTELLDVTASTQVIERLGGTVTKEGQNFIKIEIDLDKLGGTISDASDVIARRLVLKPEYVYKSEKVQAILGLTGDRLLVSLAEAQNIKLINGYKVIPDKKILIIYTKDNDVVIVDNKNKIIQKGNTYLQIREEQPLYSQDNRDYLVDFRALYGSKEIGFTIGDDPSTGNTTVTMYNNSIQNADSSSSSVTNRVNEYSYYGTAQYIPYESSNYKINIKNIDLLYKFNSNSTNSNIRDEVQEVILPFSSSNVMGNYILYGEYDANYGLENYYLVFVTPKNVSTSTLSSERDYKSMFLFHPTDVPQDKYDVHVVELNTSSESKYGIKMVPGVGWSYTLKEINNTVQGKQSFMSGYRNHSNILPFAISYEGRIPSLLNFNVNYFSDAMTKSITRPTPGSTYSPIPAAVGLQSWFTDPSLIPTISKTTITSKVSSSSVPKLFFGTMEVKVDQLSKSFTTAVGGINVGNYINLSIRGMNKLESSYSGVDSYMSPGIYSMLSIDLDVSLSTTKDVVKETEIDRRTVNVQEFFESFDDITFMDFIKGLDSSMSIAYYIITRVVPFIILSLLVIMLMISMVSDMKIVQLFCERVFDPVKILTFGNHNIQTVRNKFLILSLIGALVIMGIIQSGNLEKIIMFVIRIYYAIMLLFE